MPDNDTHIGDGNVGKLLERAYRPEAPDPEFARRVEQLMLETARAPQPAGRLQRLRPIAAFAAAALLTAGVLGLGSSSSEAPGKLPLTPYVAPTDGVQTVANLMSARPRAEAPAIQRAEVGDTIRTTEGERRRIGLPDGTVLMVNSRTTVKLSAARRISVEEGEVYVDVFPDALSRFRVDTPHREVSALGTRFGVKIGDAGLARVVVTHGKVAVSGLGQTLGSGQRFLEREGRDGSIDEIVDAAPRASHLLDWTRELVAAAESPLVPKSEYGGGALIAVDPWGQQARLTMRRYHVDVHIQDGFARTTIDQTYFNHANWRLEGTFYFPLPADASLSRLAMYVSGQLMEGGMAERSRARNVYEQIVTRRKDPALLEWLDGTTFKMRVFPLEAREEKRIVLSYTQRLPSVYGQATYRFPAGHSLGIVKDWSFNAKVHGKLHVTSDSHGLSGHKTQTGVVDYSAAARGHTFDKDVVLRLRQREGAAGDNSLRYSEATHEGQRYLMVRYRPELPVEPERQRRDWVFVFESSGSRDPLLARVQVDAIKTMLEHAEAGDRFSVLTAGTRVRPLSDGLLPVTDANVAAAVDFLEHAHLVGASDLSRALGVAGDLLRGAKNPYLVHVGSGVATIGERDPAKLARQVPAGATFVGVAVGKQWSRPYMKEAAARSGGLFTQINPDETVSWRAFDLVSTLATPRLLDTSVVDDAEAASFLVTADSVANGEEITAVARLPEGAPLPERITLTGRLAGKTWKKTVTVADVEGGAGYLPRTWARLEIDRLVAALPAHDDAEKGQKEIVDLSMKSYVMSPFTSLLVLENDKMYEQFGIDRGRKDHWAMYPAPEKIEVVREPVVGVSNPADPTARLPAENVLRTILYRMPTPLVYSPHGGYHGGGYAANIADLLNGAYGVQFRALARLDDVTNGLTDLAVPSGTFFNNSADGDFRGRTENVFSYVFDYDVDGDRDMRRNVWGQSFSPGRLGKSGRLVDLVQPFVQMDERDGLARRQLSTFLPRSGPGFLRENSMKSISGFVVDGPFSNAMFDSSSWETWTAAGGSSLDGDGIAIDLFGEIGGGSGARAKNEAFGIYHALTRVAGRSSNARSYWHRGGQGGYLQRLMYGQTYQWLMYQRRQVQSQPQYYRDLLAFAPGMNTSAADVRAVLDAEAQGHGGSRSAPGRVDDGARRLIERARAAGWQRVKVPGDRWSAPFHVAFDGTGRFAYERTLSTGLRERVVCDGKTLSHHYPDLGVGATRTFSRHHRAQITSVAPWLLPSADDLARGADVILVDERTVEIRSLRVAKTSADTETAADADLDKSVRIRLRFDDSGRLIERRAVRGANAETLLTVTYGADGGVRITDAEGKELGTAKRAVEDAGAPDLAPDTDDLIVLALPYRSRGHVHAKLQLDSKILNDPTRWTDEVASHLLGADLCQSNSQMARAVAERHIARGERVPGAYVLLTASQINWDPDQKDTAFGRSKVKRRYDAAVDLEGTAIGAYLGGALRLARNPQRDFELHAKVDAKVRSDSVDRFFWQLAETAKHCNRFVSGRANQKDAETAKRWRGELVTFAAQNTHPEWAWAVLAASWQTGGGDQEFHRGVAKALERFDGVGGLGGVDYAFRYEQAMALAQGGMWEESRKAFLELHAESIEAGMLPPIEGLFRSAVQQAGNEKMNEFVRKTARDLVERDARATAVYFLLQCRWLGQQPVTEEMFHELLSGVTDEDRLETELAAVEYLWHMGGNGRALSIVETLLEEDEYQEDPGLLQLAGALADRQGQTARGLRYVERMMDARYRVIPDILNLQTVRQEHMQLLQRFQQVANAVQALEGPIPQEFVARVVRVADRWRALDTDDTAACQYAANVLRVLGEHDLAWDYMTTPLGAKPNESTAWSTLATQLVQQGDVELADRAYETAFDIEPTNAQLLWDRAIMLQQAGRRDRARPVFQQIANGDWQPRFEGLKRQAVRYLGR